MDTPVILIGGSMTFKQGSKGGKTAWQEDKPGQKYHTAAATAVIEIALKTTAVADCDDDHKPDDEHENTDQQTVVVPLGSPSFQIDVFTVASIALGPVVSIASSDGLNISLSLNPLIPGATLCPNPSKRRLDYSSDGNCTNSDQFAKVDVTTGTGSSTSVTTLNCLLNPTSSYPKPCLGKCRIVVRCKDANLKAYK